MMNRIPIITAVLLALLSPLLGSSSCSAEREPISIAYAPFESTALFWIALDRQYFSNNGLDLTLLEYESGSAALTGVLGGKADIAVGLGVCLSNSFGRA